MAHHPLPRQAQPARRAVSDAAWYNLPKELTMTPNTDVNSPEAMLRQIDLILEEMLALREILRKMVNTQAPSVLDIVREAPGHRVFQSAEEVTRYLREARDAWDS
jgi:hypothetical protein